MAIIVTSLYLSYGIGLLLNGVLGDRFGPRRVASISWFSPRVRGQMMGFLGTNYVFGNAVSWLLSGYLAVNYGWRYIFVVPAGILLLSAIHVALRLRDTPESEGLPTLEEMEQAETGQAPTVAQQEAAEKEEESAWSHVLALAVKNPKVWIEGIAYFGVDLFRYRFLAWSCDFLIEMGAAGDKAILKVVMMPLIGAVGIVSSGWYTDKRGGRRAPVIAVMLFVSGVLAWVFCRIVQADPNSTVLPMVLLGAIGFFLYGPHLLIGATIAMDLGSRKAAGTASGIIDWLGYMGAVVAGVGTQWAKELSVEKFGADLA